MKQEFINLIAGFFIGAGVATWFWGWSIRRYGEPVIQALTRKGDPQPSHPEDTP